MLLQKLIGKQREFKMKDKAFAQLLKISRQLWQKTRTGEQPIGHKVIRGIMQSPKLSDLRPYVDIYLQEGNHDSDN